MSRVIYGTKGIPFLVDDHWYEELNKDKWIAQYDSHTKGYYARRLQRVKRKRKEVRMHRVISKPKGKEVVDHINHITNNNTEENLRNVSNRQNCQNKKIKCSSKYPGVNWHKNRKRWCANIKINNKTKYLGSFKSEVINDVDVGELKAKNLYESVLREIYGEEVISNI